MAEQGLRLNTRDGENAEERNLARRRAERVQRGITSLQKGAGVKKKAPQAPSGETAKHLVEHYGGKGGSVTAETKKRVKAPSSTQCGKAHETERAAAVVSMRVGGGGGLKRKKRGRTEGRYLAT